MIYIISYDISNCKYRNKASKILEKIGVRLQKSIFIVDLNKNQCNEIQNKLAKLIDNGDSIVFLPLCRNCFDNALTYGFKIGGAIVI
jgi:CRISPR-associated protein Cas2